MNFNEVRSRAKKFGINTHRIKKAELIQAIQGPKTTSSATGPIAWITAGKATVSGGRTAFP
jgi:hypothetical protein